MCVRASEHHLLFHVHFVCSVQSYSVCAPKFLGRHRMARGMGMFASLLAFWSCIGSVYCSYKLHCLSALSSWTKALSLMRQDCELLERKIGSVLVFYPVVLLHHLSVCDAVHCGVWGRCRGHRVPRTALPIYFFRHVCCSMYISFSHSTQRKTEMSAYGKLWAAWSLGHGYFRRNYPIIGGSVLQLYRDDRPA